MRDGAAPALAHSSTERLGCEQVAGEVHRRIAFSRRARCCQAAWTQHACIVDEDVDRAERRLGSLGGSGELASLVVSQAAANAVPPLAVIAAATAVAPSPLMSSSATATPTPARLSAVARPIRWLRRSPPQRGR